MLHCNGADSSWDITAGENPANLQLVLYGKIVCQNLQMEESK